MIEPLSEARLGRRTQRLIAILDRLGDLTVTERAAGSTRGLELITSAPGHGLPTEAVFDYSERFERTGADWRMVRYEYEYREVPGPGRLAYHWHDEAFHAHCIEAGAHAAEHHYRSYAVTVHEAHEEFAALFSRRRTVRCAHLRPAVLREPEAFPAYRPRPA